MKRKLFTILLAIILCTSIFTGVYAVKPSGNLASAQTITWNLSADVMPAPPYGTKDIPGSDVSSKLIVNQPNGAVEVVITGVMNGLNPSTVYTVYLSNGYEPYVYTGWNVAGDWVLRIVYGTTNYDHDITITQTGGVLAGIGGYPAGGSPYSYPYNEAISGTIDVMTGDITIHSVYENGYYYDAVGTIAPDGSMSGTWTSNAGQSGTWYTTSGEAVDHTGDDWYTGLFTNTIPPFTFTTDEFGSGSWHLNLRDDDFPAGSGTYILSVWINAPGATILVSDNFGITVD